MKSASCRESRVLLSTLKTYEVHELRIREPLKCVQVYCLDRETICDYHLLHDGSDDESDEESVKELPVKF